MEEVAPTARLIRALRNDKASQISSIKVNGKLTDTPEETLQHLLNHHAPEEEVSMEREDPLPAREEEPIPAPEDIFSRSSMVEAVNKFLPYKSPGPDGIYPIHLQRATPLLPHYQKIFKACLTYGYVPNGWGESKAIFLPKPGKTTYQEAKSYRMISLTSFQLKWMERLILEHINRTKNIQERLNNKQFGFRPGCSTETALHHATNKMEKAIHDGQFALAIYADIENAFPTVSFEGITKALHKLQLPKGIIRWINYMTRNRSLTATINETRVQKRICRGCPQGGILSPFLWNAVIDQLLNTAQASAIYTQAYADDLLCIVVGHDPPTLRNIAQIFIRKAEIWAKDNGLKLSPSKTEAVMYTKKRKWSLNGDLILGNQKIKVSNEAKYLGVILDQKLTFNSHIKAQITKAKACQAQARRIVGKSWGIRPHMTKWIYTAMVRPILSYAACIWYGAVRGRKVDALNRVQRLACLSITAAYPSSPTAALELLTGLTPIDLHLGYEAASGALRIRRGYGQLNRHHPHLCRNYGHIKSCEVILKQLDTATYPTDEQARTWEEPLFTVSIKNRELATSEGEAPHKSDFTCYTDGSKLSNSNTGAGSIMYLNDSKPEVGHLHLGKLATVFQAEVMAIAMTAEEINRHNPKNQTITVFSDSQAALRAIAKTTSSLATVSRCKAALNQIGTENTVNLAWVPSHIGIKGNELADEAAKTAASATTFGPEPFVPIASTVTKTKLEAFIKKEHRKRWEARTDCRQTKEAIGWPKNQLIKRLLGLSRSDLRLIIETTTGHNSLNRHRHLAGKVASPLCPKCLSEEETSQHHIGECLYFNLERTKHLGKEKLTIKEVMDHRNIQNLLGYLQATGRMEEWKKTQQ